MITKIQKIKNFGSFKDFTWEASINDFKRFNLLYGWNGSGKTTLSKLFTLIEHKNDENLIRGLTDYEFNINLEDLNSITNNSYSTNTLNLFVFNEVFVEKNIDWNNIINSILLISGAVITEKEDLEKKKLELGNDDLKDSVLWSIKTTNKLKNDLDSEQDKFYSDSAKKIKEKFKVIDTSDKYYFNYDKRKFNQFVVDNEIAVSDKKSILKESEIDGLTKSIRPDVLQEISIELKHIDTQRLETIKEKVKNILNTSLIVKEITRLKEFPKIGKWVEEGIAIHKENNSQQCEFCNQKLPEDRLLELEQHFSDEFIKLKDKITKAIEWLPTQIIKIDALENDFEIYPEFKEEFKTLKELLLNSIKIINKIFDKWIDNLAQKQSNPFIVISELETIDSKDIDAYNSTIDKLNIVINKHNNKTKNFSDELKRLKCKLELHYASFYFHDFNLKKNKLDIQKQSDEISRLTILKSNLNSDIKRLEGLLSNEAIGAGKFNNKLHRFLGRKNIILEFDPENHGYKIWRDGIQANNLSEGEKTAISFVYFITKLKENDNKIEDSIVIVDDPISSFDSNNLFSSYSFLKNECETAKQLFVITHNFAYFKLIRDWFSGKNKRKNGALIIKACFYLIEANIIDEKRLSTIKTATASLTQYGSEYHFIFSQVYKFKNEVVDEVNAYLIGNLLRKLLEAFLSFKYPFKRDNFKALCDVAIVDTNLNEKVYRFINKYSHNQTIEFYDSADDTVLSESNSIVTSVLEDIIKKIDENHYNEMKKLILEETQNAN
ncbi:MAG: AAA family ATPase [Arcobacteraceae bacterium]